MVSQFIFVDPYISGAVFTTIVAFLRLHLIIKLKLSIKRELSVDNIARLWGLSLYPSLSVVVAKLLILYL